jgi:uncharacterized protein YjbI with pentapeptide repeats
VTVVDSRLAAWCVNDSELVDFVVELCSGEAFSPFSSTGKRWRIDGCRLEGLDARGLRLQDSTVVDTRLEGSQWGGAKLDNVAFRRCDLRDAGGAAGLKGASFDTDTLISAASGLAAQLGITVADDDH